jgi:hypothetical protein
MRAYTQINYNVVALIRQDPAYKKMTSDDVLGRIMNHEMNIQEANNIKNLHMGVSTSKKQDIALKAKKRNKKKKVLIESPSEEKEEEEEEKKKRKKKTMHFIAQCPYERKEEDNDKRKKFDKGYKKDKKYTNKKPYGQTHVGQEWNSSDESSESKSDKVATIAIKGKTSSSKSLFPKLLKHTCLMAKEGRKR